MPTSQVPEPLAPALVKAFTSVTTATLTTVLSKLGVHNTWIRGARHLNGIAERIVGHAFTLRFVPIRSDLSFSETTRTAIEAMPEGCIAVADAMGVTDVGVFGDVLATRMKYRSVAGLVTDGAVRDSSGIRRSGLPVWSNGTAAPLPTERLILAGTQEVIGCGGVAVCPGDVLVCDADGVVVVPAGLVDRVAATALEVEQFEGWVIDRVAAGEVLPGLYPPDGAATARFQEWLRKTELSP
ncbi:ribonuclease activity regulator RraA [Cupriavidus sp. 2TAF22]|uniref:RraA family protein n=1 Tax=unclassified Cupriavidus TaxID=2640874 RepID=UPI003F8FF6B6